MATKATKKTVDKTANSTGSAAVILSDRLSIKDIAALRESLAAARNASSAVLIDASLVEAVDTATLQLLVGFANSIRDRAFAIEWKNPSPAFCGAADLCDLSRHLGIRPRREAADVDDGLCPVF